MLARYEAQHQSDLRRARGEEVGEDTSHISFSEPTMIAENFALLPLEILEAYNSLDDFEILNRQLFDHYFLCRALTPALGRNGALFVAEDRCGNVFWVHSLTVPVLAVPTYLVNVGDVFALRFVFLSVMPDSWDPRVRVGQEGHLDPINDFSLAILRNTPWYVAPCSTPLAWKERGNRYFADGRFRQAHAAYTRGLILDHKFVDLLSNRAAALIKLGAWDEALDDAEAVLAIDASHRKCEMRRATALMKLERYRESVDAWMRAAVLHRDIPDEKANCTAGATRALVALRQTEGQFDWDALAALIEKGEKFEVASYMHPALHFAPLKRRARAEGLFTKEALASGTLLVVESPLACAESAEVPGGTLSFTKLADAMLEAEATDARKRKQIGTMTSAAHVVGSAKYHRINSLCHDWKPFFKSVMSRHRMNPDQFGICFVSSRIDHSCEPNCTVTTLGSSIVVVQTIVNVPRGAELVAARCPIDCTLEFRRKLLSDLNITCTCRRCHVQSTDATLLSIGAKLEHLHAQPLTGPNKKLMRDIERVKREIADYPEARSSWRANICRLEARAVNVNETDNLRRAARLLGARAEAHDKSTLNDRCNFYDSALFYAMTAGCLEDTAATEVRDWLRIGLPLPLADHVARMLEAISPMNRILKNT